MKLTSVAILLAWMLVPAPLAAQDRPVVVELFTSQGCASCPPADAILHDLAARDDVIALALHVDYWDYIGWKDEFALASHTRRQKGYANVAGRNMIYTPQMIVNGTDDVVGAHAMKVAQIIESHKSAEAIAALDVDRDANRLLIHVAPIGQPLAGPLEVRVVQYAPLKSVHITRGENAGHKLDYANVAEMWTVLEEWDGIGAYEARTVLKDDRPAVVLIQYPGPGAIVAAASAK